MSTTLCDVHECDQPSLRKLTIDTAIGRHDFELCAKHQAIALVQTLTEYENLRVDTRDI